MWKGKHKNKQTKNNEAWLPSMKWEAYEIHMCKHVFNNSSTRKETPNVFASQKKKKEKEIQSQSVKIYRILQIFTYYCVYECVLCDYLYMYCYMLAY